MITHDGPFVACFKVSTGDIEDSPAPAAIHSFKTSVSNGKIYVTADEERVSKPNMSRLPKVPSNPDAGLTSGNAGVVIVGGGSGTFHSIISLREARRIFLRHSNYLPLRSMSMSAQSRLCPKNHTRPSTG